MSVKRCKRMESSVRRMETSVIRMETSVIWMETSVNQISDFFYLTGFIFRTPNGRFRSKRVKYIFNFNIFVLLNFNFLMQLISFSSFLTSYFSLVISFNAWLKLFIWFNNKNRKNLLRWLEFIKTDIKFLLRSTKKSINTLYCMTSRSIRVEHIIKRLTANYYF